MLQGHRLMSTVVWRQLYNYVDTAQKLVLLCLQVRTSLRKRRKQNLEIKKFIH